MTDAIPNREPDFFFSDRWAKEVPELWQWVQRECLAKEPSLYRMGWNVWMPCQKEIADVAKQALHVIESVQKYDQPTDPTFENSLTMREHEVFSFNVNAAKALLEKEIGDD